MRPILQIGRRLAEHPKEHHLTTSVASEMIADPEDQMMRLVGPLEAEGRW